MRKMRKVIVTLAIMAFVFGGSQALAGQTMRKSKCLAGMQLALSKGATALLCCQM